MSVQDVQASLSPPPKRAEAARHWPYVAAWLFVCVFYFIQYALRSAPGVMIPELSTAFGLTALGVSSLLGLYFYTYAGFAIVAGASLDRFGAKLPIATGVSALRSAASCSVSVRWAGRGSDGCCKERDRPLPSPARSISPRTASPTGGSPPLSASRSSSACWAASPANSPSDPLVHGPIAWQSFWIYGGAALAIVAFCILMVTPGRTARPAARCCRCSRRTKSCSRTRSPISAALSAACCSCRPMSLT